ncbi:hypothetical protein [Tropicibacter sp. S64]|uniref:hypothetical protein n=1 Tax=Tropicibacter sp. S64 TaxID=3415122 RepID=UPI003C7D9016
MIRPEAAAALARFREVFIGLAVFAVGLYWGFFTGGGILHWIGFVVLLLGIALAWIGLRRARLYREGGGAGIVEVTERQISYFAPDGGGIVSVDGLRQVRIEVLDLMVVQWVLAGRDGLLAIPIDAEGANALFDVLSALPGADFETAITAMSATEPHSYVIWSSPTFRLH